MTMLLGTVKPNSPAVRAAATAGARDPKKQAGSGPVGGSAR